MLASATVAGELFDGVAELLGVDGVAAGPPSPRSRVSTWCRRTGTWSTGVAEPSPAVVAIDGRCACSRRVAPGCTGRCQGGCVAGCVGGVRRRAGGALRRQRVRGERPVARGSRSRRGGVGRRCAATAPDRRVPWQRRVAHEPARSPPRYGRGPVRAAATEAARRARSVALSVTACSAILRSPRRPARSGSNHSGSSQRDVGDGRCRAASSGCWWARVRRWVTAGMSARSKARITSRMSLASATSVLSVTTQSRFCVAAAGGGDVQAAAGRHRRDERRGCGRRCRTGSRARSPRSPT